MGTWSRDLNSVFIFKDWWFGGVKLAKNSGLNKYEYSGFGIGFSSEFSLPDSSVGKNIVIFGVDMSSSVHVDNKKKDILIIGKGPSQGLDNTTLKQKLNIQLIFQDQIENFV